MDRILNFVALRPPVQDIPTSPLLTSASDFQQQLAATTAGPHPLDDAVVAARTFVDSGRFLADPAEVDHGVEFISLYERLIGADPQDGSDIVSQLSEFFGDSLTSDWSEDAARARDSVLAGYLLADEGPSAAAASKLVRMYSMIEAFLAGDASKARLESLLRAPLLLPDYLLNLRPAAPSDPEPPSPDSTAAALIEQFQSTLQRRAALDKTIAEILSHDEDELLLSELGEQRPLASLYRSAPAPFDGLRVAPPQAAPPEGLAKPLDAGDFIVSSPLRRAASRSNVIFADTALRLLSEPTRDTLNSLGLDPSLATVQEMHTRVLSDHDQTTQTLHTLSGKLVNFALEVSEVTRQAISGALGKWRVDPVDEPASPEPVATTPPQSFNTVKPLGVADLYLVRTHIVRYERGEVASLENILAGEKLTHTVRQLNEFETIDTTENEQVNLQTLAQTTAEQNSGKTTAQAIGAGRGPLTSDGPQSFSKSVTDQVSTNSSNRNRKTAVLRRLQRDEESMEHVFDNIANQDVRYGVYQWLDKVYQAQVFSYDTRLLYDLIIPEPAALFREALSRPRGQAALPPRPAKFSVPPDKLSLLNWSYYAAGHQAAGVEPPPQAEIIVSENFGGRAPDPFSGELSANTFELGESRTTRIPKGYKATSYRLIAVASGWKPFVLRAIIGSKTVAIDGVWGGKVFSGKLEGEVESLPVGLIADGDGQTASISTLAVGIEIICEPTEEAISAWQTKTHAQILAANGRRFADYEERVANRDATARLQLHSLSPEQKTAIIQSELKRSTLAVLTNQNFSGFNANRFDNLGFPYPDSAATTALSAYIRFFEQAVEWQHLACAFFPYFWGSRSSWVSKLLNSETSPLFSAFLTSGAARVILPIRPGYEAAFERFLNTGKTPTTEELLEVGGPLWVSLVSQLRGQAGPERSEVAAGDPWEFRLASDLVRARRDGLLPKWTLNAGDWLEEPDLNS